MSLKRPDSAKSNKAVRFSEHEIVLNVKPAHPDCKQSYPLPQPSVVDTQEYEPVESNPSLMIKRPVSRQINIKFEESTLPADQLYHTRPRTPGHVRPIDLRPNSRCGSAKTPSVRNNLDKFLIEQIALRRIKYVIDHCEAEEDHLSFLRLLEANELPVQVIQKYFPDSETIADVRVLLLAAIDETRHSRIKTAAPRISTSRQVMDEERMLKELNGDVSVPKLDVHSKPMGPNGRKLQMMYQPKQRPQTPCELLEMIQPKKSYQYGFLPQRSIKTKKKNTQKAVAVDFMAFGSGIKKEPLTPQQVLDIYEKRK